MVTGHGVYFPILCIFAETRSQHHRTGKSCYTSYHVYHRRSREIDMTVPQAEFPAELCEPASAPNPVTEYGVHKHRHEKGEKNKGAPLPTLCHCPCRYRRRSVHEDHGEQKQRENADVIGISSQENSLRSKNAQGMASNAYSVLRRHI